MASMFQRVNCQDTRKVAIVAAIIMVGIFILIYFIASRLIVSNDHMSSCIKRLKELRNDVKVWRNKCLNGTMHVRNSSWCKKEMQRNQQRMKMQTQLCFYEGPYPEPYLFLSNNSEIHAIDLLTNDKTVVIRGLQMNYGMAIDKAKNNIYFVNGSSIYKANLDGTGIEVFFENADAWKMEIDWIRRRLFWTTYKNGRIYITYLDSKATKALTNLGYRILDVAVDPTVGYLFCTNYMPYKIQRVNLVTNNIRTFARRHWLNGITLDYTYKRVYWIGGERHIFSSDYDFQHQKVVRVGSFSGDILSLTGDSLFFQTTAGVFSIIQMNMTNGITVGRIPVDNSRHHDLIVVHSSLQTMVKEGCPVHPCGPFSHCRKTNASATCQCEIGFSGNISQCTDIDECLTPVCGNKTFNNCTNFPGFYTCSCGEAYINTNGKECVDGVDVPKSKLPRYKKEPYPEPYLFLSNNSEIHAIDLLTNDKTVIIRGLQKNYGMAIDKAKNKLYFVNGSSIYRANLDGTGIEVFFENADVWKMEIDWIRRRLFWTNYKNGRIYITYLDSKATKALTNLGYRILDVAVDPTVGYLFCTNYMPYKIQRVNLVTNNIRTFARRHWLNGITLDYTYKRVYWIGGERHIFSSDYDFQHQKVVRVGSFSGDILSLTGDSLFFQTTAGVFSIIQMNMTNGITVGRIPVDNSRHHDLIVVHSSLQTMVKEGCPVHPCGPFSHCRKTNASATCQCEIGFSGNISQCTDIDECLTPVCGNKTCTNFPGFYKCACGEGYIDTNEKECVAYSDLKVRLVNPENNNSGRVEIFHPVFGWGTVCGSRWTKVEGGVVCRQLNFTGVTEIAADSRRFGAGSGPVLLDNINCIGTELYLWQCSHSEFNMYHPYCNHYFDVGVDCY